MEKKKKPEIRFEGFTDDWEQRKLGIINTFFTDGNYGEAYPKASDMTDSSSGIPFLTGGNLKEGKLSLDGVSYITPEKHSQLISGHLLEDDIVIAVRGSLGALGYVNTDNSGWNINSQLAILRTDKSELYGKFLIQYLLSWAGQNELLKRQTGSALKQLPIGALKDVEVPITSVAEQERIATYFDSLDHLITLHQRKYEKLKNVKKSMLEKMFPSKGCKVPEIRFSGFTDDWEQRKLGELAEIVGGGTPSTSVESYWDGDIDWYAPAEIGEQIYLKSSQRKITEEGLNKSSAKVLPVGTVLFTSRAGIGKTAILLKEGCTNQGFQSIVPNKNKLDSYFIFTRSEELKRYGETVGAGSTFVEVSGKQMANMELMMPTTMLEQKKIGAYFCTLDHLITLQQRELEKLKNIKKTLLEKMF